MTHPRAKKMNQTKAFKFRRGRIGEHPSYQMFRSGSQGALRDHNIMAAQPDNQYNYTIDLTGLNSNQMRVSHLELNFRNAQQQWEVPELRVCHSRTELITTTLTTISTSI